MLQAIVDIAQHMITLNLPLKYIRCDGSGENKGISKALIQANIKGVRMEFTSPRTPQQNGIVERAFQTLYNHVRSMLKHAKLDQNLRRSLWEECCNTATFLDNLIVKKNSEESSYEKCLRKHIILKS